VVWNLLTNAVKFSPSGGAISVDAAEEDENVRLAVTEGGEGIPEHYRPRLFETFSQADASLARPHSGLGLGLAIVRRLVEAHGGHVEAESRGPGQGATFTVNLPLSQRAPSETLLSSLAPVGELRGCRILVVEDDPDSAELTKTLLEEADASVSLCTGARQALAVIERGDVEVLVADIGLPRDDGFWLIQQVRSLPRVNHRTLPAVALTAFASARDRHSALAAGYDEHVAKPLDVDVLLHCIARVRAKRSEGRNSVG
jgi:CheY-like chemotaxis protein